MWVVLAAIAVTGFAAFDPDDDAPPPPGSGDRSSVVALADSALFDFEAPPPSWVDPVPPPTTTTLVPTTTTLPITTTTRPLVAPATTAPATTTTTTPPTTTTVPSPGPPNTTHPAAVEAWRTLVEEWFPASQVDRALDVMWCESRGDAQATHPTSGAAGLYQHLPRYWQERSGPAGFAGADIYDPVANVGVAAWLVATDGWKHWYPSLHCWG